MQYFDPKKYPNLALLDEKVKVMLLSDRAKKWSTPRTQYEIARIHPVFFLEEYGRIRPDRRELGEGEEELPGGVIPFRLNTVQLQIADKICAHYTGERFSRVQVIVLKHRKAGISTLIAGFDYWHMRFHDNLNAFVIADLTSHTSNITEMILTFHKHDTCGVGESVHRFCPPRKMPMPRGKNGVRLENGSMLEQDTGENANPGTSATITVCHMSENSKWRAPEDAETSLLNSIPRSGYAFIVKESTAFGINKYAKDCEDSEMGKSAWEFIFVNWLDMEDCEDVVIGGERIDYDNDERELLATYPNMRPGHIKFRRRQIELLGSPAKFRQDFPLNPREPFLVTGYNFFNTVALEKRISEIKFYRAWKSRGLEKIVSEFPDIIMRLKHSSLGLHGALLVLEDNCVVPFIVQLSEGDYGVSCVRSDTAKVEDGAAIMYRQPRERKKYVVVVDVAEGKRSHEYVSDNSIIDVYDAYLREQVMQWGGVFDEEVTAMYAIRIAKVYNNATIVVEMNNKCGGVLWSCLENMGYRNLYHRETVQSNRTKREPGWHTSVGLKTDICSQLRMDFKNGNCIFHSLDTLEEMMFFVDVQGRLQGAEGHNDDRVMVAAIGMKVIATTPSFHTVVKPTVLVTDIAQSSAFPSNRREAIRRYM